VKLREQPPLHLTYCLNVHPGETWAENRTAIREKATAVRDRVGRPGPFGLGLRLSRRAADELLAPGQALLEELRSLLAEQGMYAFTVNGFPYGAFHGRPVKQEVYRPDWRAPERLDYTRALAAVLAAVLPPGVPGSISTVPGSYKAWVRTGSDAPAMARALADCALELANLEERTGAWIVLALEPEPDCYLETTAETVRFFEEQVFGAGAEHFARRRGASRAAAVDRLRRHVGVCLDTCHLALQFEEPAESLRVLARRGIAVPKIQLSAALRFDPSRGDAAALDRFVDAVYLHQVKIRGADGVIRAQPDLDVAAVRAAVAQGAAEIRSHFHVPLYFEGAGGLESTASLLDARFFAAARAAAVPHWEMETYTFHVLPAELQALGVEESVAREYRWVLQNSV
jgi:sugar phosphate isomerase/epimerase